jgi:dienelactone hydrolase
VLVGDSTLPTHAIYRPRDLSKFGGSRLLPVVAWANGGCRNTSGEFRNFLTEVASHGFLVVAIGPAAYAIALGSEQPVGGTRTSQFFDGLGWAIAENERKDSSYYRKLDPTKFAIMGQSCGGVQALEGLSDPRVKTAMVWNSGLLGAGRGARRGAPGEPTATTPSAPGTAAPPPARAGGAGMGMPTVAPEALTNVRVPVALVIGGPSDVAFAPAKATFDALANAPVFLANRDVGHYPATYRQPHGGAFAAVAVAWLKWQLNGDTRAAASFVGKNCTLCRDPNWTVEKKRID